MKKILIISLMSWALMAQSVTNFSFNLVDVNEISINDLDIFGGGTVKNLLSAGFDYNYGGTNSMQIQLTITRNSVLLLSGSTNIASNATSGSVSLNSTNFNSGVSINTSTVPVNLKVGNYDFKTDVLSAAELALGALPNGTYAFTLNVLGNGSTIATQTQTLNINNDWQVDLSSPSDWEIISTRPFFQWTTNNQLFAALTLYVWEINNPGATDDEIASALPIYREEFSPNTLDHQYPPTESQLVNGKSYAWTVKGTVKKVSGNVELENVINKFTFQKAGTAASTARILGLLRSILRDNYDGVMKEFKGFSPTGQIKLNGSATTAQDLSAIINAIQAGQKKIQVETK